MADVRISRARFPFAFAFFCSVAAPALAQYPAGATVQQLPSPNDPAELLAQALRTLATEPNNIQALTAAGRNALVLGDPNAAVGFLGRASELAPRDGQVKAGLGSALVQLEKPADALRLFGEASALGVPDADLAEDRGLAFDLSGDSRRAQRDYATVLASHPDDDTARRRLALSQGISGDKATAIATLDPLIRKRDIAGWRAQTFVLAMNGDAAGAGAITHIMMPQQADRMQPFLVRLSTLSPADKARAVHFGEMPQSGSSYSATQLASTGAPATYATAATAPTLAPAPTPAAKPPRRTRIAAVPPEDVAETPAAPSAETPAPRARVAARQPSNVPPSREPATPPQTVAVAAPAPAPRRDATPARPTLSAAASATASPPVTVAVASDAPAAAAPIPAVHETQRFYGPPAEPASASTPAGTQVALESTPAPLAATAFETTAAPTAVSPAGTPSVTTVSSSPTPILQGASPMPVPQTAPPAVAVQSGAATPAAIPSSTPATPQPEPLPAVAPTGHYDLPHDSAAPRAASPVRTSSTPVVHQPDAPARKDKAAVADKGRSTGRDAGTADAPATKARGRNAADDSAEDVAATDKSVDADAGKGRRGSGTTRTARSSDADDGTPARGKAGTRKGKAEEIAANEEPGASPRRKGARASDRTPSDDGHDSSTKGRKGRNARSDETDTAKDRKPGARDGKSTRAEAKKDKDGAAPKVFVQVAGGANKDDLDKAWAGVKAKAPDLMKGHMPSTTPLKATNRLLIGPFKSDEEAQAFVNKMAGKGLSGFTFKSAKGQKIDKVDPAK